MASVRRIAPYAAALSLLAATAAHADSPAADQVKRGEYLARAGDCFSCHTKEGGADLAGGRLMPTPFGAIASPNITPDKDTGIGTWSDDDFYRLMHDGIGKQGEYIYPVMPYDHFTRVTRDDVMAIKAYLFSLKPVHAPKVPSQLSFPFSIRTGLLAWRALYFTPGTFQPDPQQSAQVNRGAYLVEGLAHCGSCHTPRNAAMGSESSKSLGGGEIKGQGWFAPNISSDVREGIGGWSQQQLVQYLKEGVAPGRAVAAGPMSETIHKSLAYLSGEDLNDIALYLKASPAKALYAEQQVAAPPGASAYLSNCAFCHQPDGKGIAGAVPPLAGNGVAKAGGPEDVIRTILGGLPAQGEYAPMPGFATQLTGDQIAGLANYVRAAWGNNAPGNATPELVDRLGKLTRTMWAGTGDCAPAGSPAVAAALAKPEVADLLHKVNAGNMLEQIDAILPKVRADDANAPQADLVNGLVAGYCPIARADTTQAGGTWVELLQRVAMLTFSQVSSKGLQMDPSQHASVPSTAAPN
jgi:mono/diheme cytochrome c family protein